MTQSQEKQQSTDVQCADAVIMIRPAAFGRNDVTRPSNFFQTSEAVKDPERTAAAAVTEFDGLASALKEHGITVHEFPGRTTTPLPDEVFPNNWISTHADGTVVLYPMMAWNRRPERRRDIVDELQKRANGYRIGSVIDLSRFEANGIFLEGTGSLVLDRINRIGYSSPSPRTHIEALKAFARRLNYGIVTFDARDRMGRPVFHTNTMMSLGERFAVVCMSAIQDVKDRFRIVSRLEKTGRKVIDLTLEQLHAFAGNILELKSSGGSIIVLSTHAAASLTDAQKEQLGSYGKLVTASVDTIEKFGGGSVRCMLAEIFLPPR